MKESFKVTATMPATPETVYEAWMSSRQHGEMIGGVAKIDPKVKGKHMAWDGYITGTNLELVPGQKIVQSWRTTEFPEGSTDSLIEVRLEKVDKGTKLSLEHRNIPEGQGAEYKAGWKQYYFTPMKKYFANL